MKPKSFAAICGDLINHQLRSAIGAMLLGVLGGVALGIPIYSGLANSLFGRTGARFNLAELHERVPSTGIDDSWWLNPPSFLSGPAFLVGVLYCLVLGILIRKVVKPQDSLSQ